MVRTWELVYNKETFEKIEMKELVSEIPEDFQTETSESTQSSAGKGKSIFCVEGQPG